jgi:hypothetical protein
MVSICKDSGQEFLSTSEYKRHQQRHLQTRIDKWSSNSKPEKVNWKPPDGMSQDLFKIFEKITDLKNGCRSYDGKEFRLILS